MRRLILALIILGVTSALEAQETAQNADPAIAVADRVSVAEVLGLCVEAMGSTDPLTAWVVEGQVLAYGQSQALPIVIESLGAQGYREEVSTPEGPAVAVVAGGKGESMRQQKKRTEPLHATQYHRAAHIPAAMCMPDPAMAYSLEKDAVVNGRAAYHVKLAAAAQGKDEQEDRVDQILSEYHLYVDKQTGVALKSSFFAFSPDAIENRSTVETYYSEYRNVNGVLMPFHLETYLAGTKIRDLVFTSIRADITLTSRDFTLE